MLKQSSSMKKGLAVLLVVLFVVSLTSVAVSAQGDCGCGSKCPCGAINAAKCPCMTTKGVNCQCMTTNGVKCPCVTTNGVSAHA